MRNAILAPMFLVMLAAAAGMAALMPAIMNGFAGPVTDNEKVDRAVAKDSAFLQKARRGGFQRSRDQVSKAPLPFIDGWAEQMFPAGLVKDFGTVPHGTRLFHSFPVTNVHAVPVEITGLRQSCGCVQATRAKRVLQPGESTTIDVSLDTREFTGQDTETIRVAVGPTPVSTCELSVSAVSRTDVLLVPDRIAFGLVTRDPGVPGSPLCTEIEHLGGADWKIEEVVVPKELPVEATLRETLRRPGKVAYRLTVALKPDAPAGRIRGYVNLRTNQKSDPPLPVMVTATVPRQTSVPKPQSP
jgi:hypothetical protein